MMIALKPIAPKQMSAQVCIMHNFYDDLFVGIKENPARLYKEPENIEKIIQQHTGIQHAVQQHEPAAAFEGMRAHIDFVLDFFKNA